MRVGVNWMSLGSLRFWRFFLGGVHPSTWEPLSLLCSKVALRPQLRFETCCSRRVLAGFQAGGTREFPPSRGTLADSSKPTAPAAPTTPGPPLLGPRRISLATRPPSPKEPPHWARARLPGSAPSPAARSEGALCGDSRAAPPADPGASGRRRTLGPSGCDAGRRGSGRVDTAAEGRGHRPRGHRAGTRSGPLP